MKLPFNQIQVQNEKFLVEFLLIECISDFQSHELSCDEALVKCEEPHCGKEFKRKEVINVSSVDSFLKKKCDSVDVLFTAFSAQERRMHS